MREGTETAEILAILRRWEPLLQELEAALPTIRAFVDNPVGNYVKNMRRNRERTSERASRSPG